MSPKRPELYPGLPVTEGMLVPVDRSLPPVPLRHTSVRAKIIGPIVDLQVTQRFHNTHTRPIEALYVFPLPEDAAVTDFTLTIGERVIQGVVRERTEARAEYDQARDQGQGAALLEQERPNMFAVSVANIQPDEQVEVALRFHDRVPYDDGAFEFVFPTVVLPRYTPRDSSVPPSSPLLPEHTRDGHTISIEVLLDAGRLRGLTSPSHEIDVRQEGSQITLRQADSIPNKDFVLRYRVAGEQFEASAFTYRPEGKPGTLLLMLMPQAELLPEDVLPRELLFVFDRSGSMGGDSIVQARNALRACLRSLNPDDTFNIFPFDHHVEQFAPHSLSFAQEHVDRADAYIEQLHARGGTEILGALQAALQQPVDPERLRVVVFLTDGAVGNEDQVLRELRRSLGMARVFAFGIGSAVNRFLLDKLAEVGRGVAEYIFPGQEIEEAVQRFQNRAAFPLLADLSVDWAGARVTDVLPNPLPDLYSGQPLVLLARFHSAGRTHVKLAGRTQRGRYEQAIDVDWPESTPDRNADWAALAKIWARGRIAALEGQVRDNPRQRSAVRDEILGLALEYHLISPYTSFVAIEERSPEHAKRQTSQPVEVPIHLPAGTQREAFERPSSGNVHLNAMMSAPMPQAPPSMKRTRYAAPPPSSLPVAPSSPPPPPTSSLAGGFLDQIVDKVRGVFDSDSSPVVLSPARTASLEETIPVYKDLDAGQRVDLALRYLGRTQGVSGAWAESQVATALALLAFVRAGHTDRAGSFRPQLTRAIRWLAAQASQPQAAPVIAWALAELAAATGVETHLRIRDAALASITPRDEFDRACIALARGEQVSAGGGDGPPADEQSAVGLALRSVTGEAPAVGVLLAPYQHAGGSASGAVAISGHSISQPDAVLFAATAVGALAWNGR